MEIVSITEVSKETNCEISNPIEESSLVVRNSILIPTDDSLERFINCELFDYLSPSLDTGDGNRLREYLRDLLITVIRTNIDFVLTRIFEAPNDVAANRQPRTAMPNNRNNFLFIKNIS